ncbi:MAG: MoxR family ATPase, partial [Bacteroidota bacterium]
MENESLQNLSNLLESNAYIADRKITLALYLAQKLQKPLLIEGPAGVGKTEIAKVMATALKADLIRLQCYVGLDASQALYEWNYQKQLLHIKMEEASSKSIEEKEDKIFSESFLLKRPLLEAITNENPTVLLIDEIDRSDEEFESFLLEFLSDWQISIPEMGTIKAKQIPQTILTSNRVRELSEALRRRCLYIWIDYPDYEKELSIVKRKVPDINETLAAQICKTMIEFRRMRLNKLPGVAETLDWAMALAGMHFEYLDKSILEDSLGIVLKDWQDIRTAQDSLSELFDKVGV